MLRNLTQSFVVVPQPPSRLLSQWSLPPEVLEKYSERSIRSMFKWQSRCLSLPGVLTEKMKNLVICAPTSAGKTMVAELIALKCVLERKKKVLIIVPFVSIAQEKADYLQSIFEPAGVKVGGFTGNQSPEGGFDSVHIAICTIEKANSLVNHLLEKKAVKALGVVVVDELHMIGDGQRGCLLELLLTKILYMSTKSLLKIQLVGMSLNCPDVDLLAEWLQAEVCRTKYRPIKLTEMVKIGSTLYDTKFNVIRSLDCTDDEDDILLLVKEHVLKGQSVVIFCWARNKCESLASTLAEAQGEFRKSYPAEAKKFLDFSALDGVCKQLDGVLKRTVSNGVAFHHAGLTFEKRKIIEDSFRHKLVNVLVATTTLSSGVNLPAELVIVTTPYFKCETLVDIFVYKQMSGRAGRKGMCKDGESILMCEASDEPRVKRLFQSAPKPLQSSLCLSKESQSMNDSADPLKRALLEVIASRVAVTKQEIMLYFSCTLFYSERRAKSHNDSKEIDVSFMQDPVSEALEFLLKHDFISSRARLASEQLNKGGAGEQEFSAYQLGLATVASALSPEQALVVFEELNEGKTKFISKNELYIIYLMISGEMQKQWGKKDKSKYHSIWTELPEDSRQLSETLGISETFWAQAVNGYLPYQMVHIYRRFFMALALQELMHEVPIMQVAEKYMVTEGLLQYLRNYVEMFAGMVTVFCGKLDWTDLERQIRSQFAFDMGSNTTDFRRTSKRAREFLHGGSISSDSLERPNLCEKRCDNNTIHSMEPSSAPDSLSMLASTPYNKKAKLSPEEVTKENSHGLLLKDSLELSPITVQTSLTGSGTATPTLAPASQSSTQSEELSATNAAAQLSDADLVLVFTEVYAARDKWPDIGLALKIPYDKIECIEGENVDADTGLRKMFLVWLRTGTKKTWRFLAEALGHGLVKEVHLMNSIIERLSPTGILTATKESDIRTVAMTTNSDNLSDSDIADVLVMAQEASTKWYNIGLALGLHCSILERIEASAATTQKCLRKMLVTWLRTDIIRKWGVLAEVMGNRIVDRQDLKEEILKKKC